MNKEKEIIFIVGPPKCGKSAYAEKLIASCNGIKCYVGTLPKTIIYRNCIVSHQKRRPSNWLLLELTGDLKGDLSLFQNINPYPDIFLLDGLTFYFLRALSNTSRSEMPYNISKFIQHNLKLILKSQSSFIIVDNIRLKSHNKLVDSLLSDISVSIKKELKEIGCRYIRF